MVATDAQRNFAASTINYFNIDLKGGANDKIKALVKATKETAADKITLAIKSAKTTTETDKNNAIAKAGSALKTVNDDIAIHIKSTLTKATAAVTDLKTKIANANSAASKIADVKQQSAVTTPLTKAETAVANAVTELAKVDVGTMATLTGDALKKAIIDAKTAITAASEAINDTTKGAIAELGNAATAANQIDANDTNRKAVIDAVTEATTAGNTANNEIGDSNKGLVKDATTAGTDYASYVSLQATADAMKVGDDPVMTAAKAYNLACGNKLNADFSKVLDSEVIACNTELLKGYGFINAILKNIPNAGKDVLTDKSGVFDGYGADLEKPVNADKLKAANAYYKIALTVTGGEPFTDVSDIPEPRDYTAHSKHVENTLVQLNAISHALLQDSNCGTGAGTNIAKCYEVHAKDVGSIYTVAGIDAMNIDVSAQYLFEEAFKGNDDFAKLDL